GVIRLIFEQFDRQGTVHGVLRYLRANDIRLPLRAPAGPDRGQLSWRPPCRETIRHILRHPLYAGAYRYGFRPTDPRRQTPGRPKSGRGSGQAAADCLVLLRDRFPAYISWEQFEANHALLAGLVWCGRCGKRMYVRYGRRGQRATYVCSTLRSDYGLPLCQATAAAEVESWAAQQLLAALQPAALEASLAAAAEVEAQRLQLSRHWEQRLERARYEAERAARQYRACEPENRLVARTLEQQWEERLQDVQRLEAEFERFERAQPRPLGAAEQARIRQLAEEVPALWQSPTTTPADRRQLARLLLERVVLQVAAGADQVTVRLEWAGGAVREATVQRAVNGYRQQQDWPRLLARLTALHQRGRSPAAIATALNRGGFRPPKRADQFTASMVRRLLHEVGLRLRVPRHRTGAVGLQGDEQWLQDLARQLGLSPHTLHGWRKKGWLQARQVGGRGGPWAVWADAAELKRLRELKECPRLWTNRERLAELRVPKPRS